MAKYLSEAGLAHLWTNILKPLFASKVDKVAGKGLSSLDFTQAYLNRIGAAEDGITTLGSTKVDKIGGKGLSTNDFTTAYKDLVDQNAADISAKTVPSGGSIGQALTKTGATDYATGWATIPRQYTTMPTITAELLGSVAQYVGVTGTYTFGHFYAAVSDGESTPTYSWEEIVYGDPNSVSYSEQTGKTEANKAQARTNIGAAAVTNVITAFGEIGYSTATTVYGQITAIKQPNGKYTISICAVPTAITRGSTFSFLSIAKIVALLGLSGALSWTGFNSRVTTTATISAAYMEYGLVVKHEDSGDGIWLGRVYTTGGAIGAWPLSETGFFVLNAQYLMWIYDVTIA